MLTAIEILQEKNREMISVPRDTEIHEAVNFMNKNSIGAMLVKDGDEIVGIWTERDLLRNIGSEGFNYNVARIGDYMSTGLTSAPAEASVYQLLDIFLGKRMRHVLIEKDGKYVGLLSQGDVIKASLNEKIKEIKELNQVLDWDYYENWRFNWKHKD